MSAISSNSDDRDREALRRAQRAHEPSMEEILASIRNIIADDREPAKGAAYRPTAPAAGPQIVYSKDFVAPALRGGLEPAPRPEPAAEASAPKVVWRQPEPVEPEPVAPPLAAEAEPAEEAPLMSPGASEAVGSSFDALKVDVALRTAEIADGMVRDMLRPMLRQWLDENLPGIVERLVRAEIQRVARGPK